MKMGRLINKGKSLIVTVWTMSLITTNAEPKLWQVGLIGILMYETVLMTLETYQKATRRKRKQQNIAAGRADMKRVEEERLYWLKRGAC